MNTSSEPASNSPNFAADALQTAIANLYQLFAAYPLSPHVNGCPHCVADADHRQLHARPLHDLTADNLYRYAYKALTTWGNESDFRHFLPRLLDLTVSVPADFPNPEIVFGKLGYAKWHTWPLPEQAAIQMFLAALWQYVLSHSPEAQEAIDWLCAIAQAEDDLEPYLSSWVQDLSPTAGLHLAHLLIEHGQRLITSGRLNNAFMSERPEQTQQILIWLATPAVHDRLETGFFSQASDETEPEFSLALMIQEQIAQKSAALSAETNQ